MNRLISAVQNRDAGALARIAENPVQERVVNANAEKLVDALFDNLIRLFPAARNTILATPEDVAAMKRQWILAFVDGGITTVDQVRAGVKMARTQGNDFWPSCSKFIAWCREADRAALGLPSDDDVMDEFQRYARDYYQYTSPEEFNWSHPVMYWVVLDVRHLMHEHNYTSNEVLRSIQKHMRVWEKKIRSGESIPSPMKQIADKRRPPSAADILDPNGTAGYLRKGAEMLARIRERVRAGGQA
ncbi:TPA: DNA replication protein [Salmonella enterica]|uniref:DNA replication protein n=1 Tax=Salmonella enterica TaxID=28901 RepID=A0A743PG70_SALER|nr:DNA replication protein [Salmonella enterica]